MEYDQLTFFGGFTISVPFIIELLTYVGAGLFSIYQAVTEKWDGDAEELEKLKAAKAAAEAAAAAGVAAAALFNGGNHDLW